MKVTITSSNINSYASGLFPEVTSVKWSIDEYLYEDVLARFPNVIEFDCSKTKITSLQGISKLTNLQELHCYHNDLTSLQGIEQLTNLQILYCSCNRLTTLQDIRTLTSLQKLYCSCNRLTTLQGIEKLVGLQDLQCTDNQLVSLDGIYGLTRLQNLIIYKNEITSLDGINNLVNLRILNCSGNQITNLDPIIYLRHLSFVWYFDNPIENPSVQVKRFLERYRQFDSRKNIYNDGQNVHDVTIQTSTKNSLSSLMRDTDDEFNLTDVLQSNLSESSRNAITEYCSDDSVHSYFLVTYRELFSRVWNRIVDNVHSEELLRILDEQTQDAECKCMTGRFVRTMSVLVGFYDDIVIGISDNSQIAAIIETVRKSIIPYDAQRHADIVHQQLTEMGYDETQISPWADAILDS